MRESLQSKSYITLSQSELLNVCLVDILAYFDVFKFIILTNLTFNVSLFTCLLLSIFLLFSLLFSFFSFDLLFLQFSAVISFRIFVSVIRLMTLKIDWYFLIKFFVIFLFKVVSFHSKVFAFLILYKHFLNSCILSQMHCLDRDLSLSNFEKIENVDFID
jgi:hypothetical protein